MYLNSINSYRAIAIFMIVSAHCYSISEVTIDSFPEALFANMTAGSTFYFIFISGFLFHHIFVLKNKIPNFFTGKLKKLLIPYTILSIVPIILKLWFEPNFWSSHINFIESSLLVSTTFQIILYYFTGAHLVAYWYIPFAVCLFALYPLHVKFINLTLKKQLLILFRSI